MELLILVHEYPEKENLYANAFVHRRVLEYAKQGHSVRVFVLNEHKRKEYEYENIIVTVGSKERLLEYMGDNYPSAILIHFINKDIMDSLNEINIKIPVIVWIHGFEALGWYRRIFNLEPNIKSIDTFLKYIYGNTIQMFYLRKYIKSKSAKFIFVSEWMRKITEKDTFTKIDNYEIIHNIIDTELFSYKQKNYDARKKILLIRPFASRKYATDIAVNSIIELSKKPFFEQLEITIVGKGRLFQKDTEKIKNFKNVKLIEGFLSQKEIAELHKEYGIFLCPTRQDSQGVSMCEAMSSGLVAVSSNNTAIPEFIKDNETGFLSKNHKDIARKIELLYNDEKMFTDISIRGSKSIQQKCSYSETVIKELEIIKKYVSQNEVFIYEK